MYNIGYMPIYNITIITIILDSIMDNTVDCKSTYLGSIPNLSYSSIYIYSTLLYTTYIYKPN